NAVTPGVIKTPMNTPETHASLAGLHPLGRMGEVQEIVDAVLYLESATFVTGETLHVDGGAHAGHWGHRKGRPCQSWRSRLPARGQRASRRPRSSRGRPICWRTC